jgi:uncharacterized membrane protein
MICPDCPPIREAHEMFFASLWPYLAYALLPFVVLAAVVAAVAAYRRRMTPGLLLGIGLGGFVDGILLHQILQWHNMLSNVVPPSALVAMKFNMVWDGLFHALTWAATLFGIVLLARRGVTSGRALAGSMIAGWGLFNFVEGLIDHQILGLHHVHPGSGQLVWDLAFLVGGGIGFMALGFVIARSELAGHVAV